MRMATIGQNISTRSRPIPHLRWWICGVLFASTVINYIECQTLSWLDRISNRTTTGPTPITPTSLCLSTFGGGGGQPLLFQGCSASLAHGTAQLSHAARVSPHQRIRTANDSCRLSGSLSRSWQAADTLCQPS